LLPLLLLNAWVFAAARVAVIDVAIIAVASVVDAVTGVIVGTAVVVVISAAHVATGPAAGAKTRGLKALSTQY